MIAERFLDWLYYFAGLDAYDARRLLDIEARNQYLDLWISLGCPYPVGV